MENEMDPFEFDEGAGESDPITTKPAGELAIGDVVVERDGSLLTITKIRPSFRDHVEFTASSDGPSPVARGRLKINRLVRIMVPK